MRQHFAVTGGKPTTKHTKLAVASLALGTAFGLVVGTATAGGADTGSSQVVTGAATAVTDTSATLSGSGQISGRSTLYVFDYGTNATFGSSAMAGSIPGGQPGALSAALYGLKPATTYYYRLVGTQGSTVIPGATRTFITGSVPTTTTTAPSPTTTNPPPATSPPSSSTTQPHAAGSSPPVGGSPQLTNPFSVPGGPPSGLRTPHLPDGLGYWLASTNGAVQAYGDAPNYGDASKVHLTAPVVGIVSTPDGLGYWLFASDGGVFSFGDAGYYGSPASEHPSSPIVGLVPTGDGRGYWLAGADGAVFAFGDATYLGSPNSILHLGSPLVSMATTPDGGGYWLVAADGSIYTYGDAGFYGSLSNVALSRPVVGLETTPDGDGYWLVGADGGVFAFGDAAYYGSLTKPLTAPTVHLATSNDGRGYWLTDSAGVVTGYGDAGQFGTTNQSAGAGLLGAFVVGMAVPNVKPLADVPAGYVALDQQAAATCPGLPWEILTAIGKVESDFGRSTLPGVSSGANAAGAAGPMQIGVGGAAGNTFSAYSHPVRADEAATPSPPGQKPPSVYNPADAVFAAARDLCTNGGGKPDKLNSAILAYNHAQWYATEVETLAAQYAGSSHYGETSAPVATAIQLAVSQIGTPYVWGGSSPDNGFDCSGLVQWAYGAAGVSLPRTSEAQWADLSHIAPGTPLQAGDLVFFEPAPDGPGHVGIYLGGNLMIDAPHTGANVRIDAIDMSSYVGAATP